MSNEHLVITDVTIDFPTPNGYFRALEGVNLTIDRGEFISIIGHSGCGKSTVLNIVAGLYQATQGGVILDSREVKEPGPDRAVVFQNHSLLPWLSAYENVELAVKQVFKGQKSRKEMDEWIKHNLELVHMSHAMHKRPGEISGGMKQRVGIARALAMEPKVLLMDEPFGALDALTRTHMQDSLMEIHQNLKNTVIMITHDVDEAVLLSDRIVMMSNGPAATVGDILHIDLERPRNRLELADDPAYNHFRAEVVRFLHERHTLPVEGDSGEGNKPGKSSAPEGQILDLEGYRGKRSLEKHKVKLGFVPLIDCAPLVVAKEKGFFAQQGLDVTLSRESTWANIRDKVCYGVLDGAQMLPGIPLSTAVESKCKPMIASMSLGLNGNAITISNALYERLTSVAQGDIKDPLVAAQALKAVIEEDQANEEEPLTFAVVFPESSHNYLLRYWLASAGIDPDKDVTITVVPPPQMVSHLETGVIAGYCVGEPWNTQAVYDGIGKVLVTSFQIWNNHPEKVFGCTRAWADANPKTHQAILMALLEACAWLDDEKHHDEACELLSKGRYVNAAQDVIAATLNKADFNQFHRYAANYPWRSDATWTLTQMARWGYFQAPIDLRKVADAIYRPETYRAAAEAMGMAVPAGDYKTDGEHASDWSFSDAKVTLTLGADRFMDKRVFDPDRAAFYIDGFSVKSGDFNLDAWLKMNKVKDSSAADDSKAV